MSFKSDKVAVIGAGPMGLAVAYELILKGYKPEIFEADNRIGGMAASFNFDGLEIERYYHFHCLNDYAFFDLLDEIGLKRELKWKKTKMGFFYQNKLYKWGSLKSVLFFNKVSLFIRIRYLLQAFRCLTIKDWSKLDKISAVDWLKKWLGIKGYSILWGKLFEYKFYNFSSKISAAWIWSRIKRLGKSRKGLEEKLGYLNDGSLVLINKLEKIIKKNGGTFHLSNPVLCINPIKNGGAIIKSRNKTDTYDSVITTIPIPLLTKIFIESGIDNNIIKNYEKTISIACACIILKTRKKVTDNFWTNINDNRYSIPGIVEMSNLRELDSHITYVPFYVPQKHPNYLKSDSSLIKEAWDCIKAINPNLEDKDLISSCCNRYRYAQPVIGTEYKKTLPSKEPFKRLFTVDTTFYYPEDRGISESIGFGRDLVRNNFK